MLIVPNETTWLLDSGFIDRLQEAARIALADDGTRRAAAARSTTGSRGTQSNRVAVLNLSGPIESRQSLTGWLLGGTPADEFGDAFESAVLDKGITSIILRINSPGGTTAGTPELADRILAARGRKPIVALVDPFCASAALWVASAADQIVATPSAEVGSVGALVVHLDRSERLRKDGITPTIIRSPAAKAEFNSLEPLTAAALEHEQANISRLHHEFVQTLARNRGVPANIVLRDFGRGRMMPADAALKTGMIDRIGTFQSVVQGALRQAQQPSPGYAAARSALRQKQSDLARRLRNQQRMRQFGTQRPTRPGAVGTSSALRPKQSDLARRLRNQQRMRQLETHRPRGRR